MWSISNQFRRWFHIFILKYFSVGTVGQNDNSCAMNMFIATILFCTICKHFRPMQSHIFFNVGPNDVFIYLLYFFFTHNVHFYRFFTCWIGPPSSCPPFPIEIGFFMLKLSYDKIRMSISSRLTYPHASGALLSPKHFSTINPFHLSLIVVWLIDLARGRNELLTNLKLCLFVKK